MENIMYWFLIFIIYSFLGYLIEVGICSLEKKKFINRGFLLGPICPIYGVGALVVIFTLTRYEDDPIVVFILGMFVATFVEYMTSYLLEKLFHNKWWDYSDRKNNINGRICLDNAVAFGIMALALIYAIEPSVEFFVNLVNKKFMIFLGIILFVGFLIDVIYSVIIAYGLRNRTIIVEELKKNKATIIPKMFEKKVRERFAKYKTNPAHFFKAFPNLSSINNKKDTELIKKILINQKKDKKTKKN